MTTKSNLYLFTGTAERGNIPTARPSTGVDMKDALINLAATAAFEYLPDDAARTAALSYLDEQCGAEWEAASSLERGIKIDVSDHERYTYRAAQELAGITVHPGGVYYFEERRSVFIKSRAVARHSSSHGWTNLVGEHDNPLHLHTLNAFYFDDRRGGPPGEQVAHKLSFIMRPPPTDNTRALPLREAMRIAAEAAEGQLDGYFDEETGKPIIDESDPTRDHHAIFVVQTIYHAHYSHGDREYNLTALAAAFHRAKDKEFEAYAEAYEAELAAEETPGEKVSA
jgi:hypothetical protein